MEEIDPSHEVVIPAKAGIYFPNDPDTDRSGNGLPIKSGVTIQFLQGRL